MWPGRKVGKLAPIFMTAVLEYLVAEVLEQAGLLSRHVDEKKKKKNRIDPKHIRLAVIHDEEFKVLFKGGIFLGSGGGRPELCGARQILEGDLSTKLNSCS